MRQHVYSGTPLEPALGYSRAIRVGDLVCVSATAAIWPDGHVDPSASVQAERCLEIVATALSVMIQVFSFQTFRKRVFLMAPIHHHFELMSWSETKIILRFWIIAAICSAIGFTLYQQSIT